MDQKTDFYHRFGKYLVFLQFIHYLVALYRYYKFGYRQHQTKPNIYINNIDLESSMKQNPDFWLIQFHLIGAVLWTLLVMIVKHLALKINTDSNPINHKKYRKYKKIAGYTLLFIMIFTSLFGSLVTYIYIHNLVVKVLLGILPFYVAFLLFKSVYSIKIGNVLAHKYWGDIISVNAVYATIIAETSSFVLQRFVPSISIGIGYAIAITFTVIVIFFFMYIHKITQFAVHVLCPTSTQITDIKLEYTASDVRRHNKKEDAWIIIDNKVYDITNFINHPGSLSVLLTKAGKDVSKKFKMIKHSKVALAMMNQYYVGNVSVTNDIGLGSL